MKMRGIIFTATALAVLLTGSPVLAAGSYGSYFYDDCRRDTFGESFHGMRDAQILNPDAGSNLAPVEGIDGQAADISYMKYIESFSKQKNKAGSEGGGVGFLPVVSLPGGGGK